MSSTGTGQRLGVQTVWDSTLQQHTRPLPASPRSIKNAADPYMSAALMWLAGPKRSAKSIVPRLQFSGSVIDGVALGIKLPQSIFKSVVPAFQAIVLKLSSLIVRKRVVVFDGRVVRIGFRVVSGNGGLVPSIVACKAINQIQRAMTLKQGQGKVGELTPIAYLASDDCPTASYQALLNDCYEHHVVALPDELRPFAELHLAGVANADIAEQLDCVERTVERKLALLRTMWRKLADDSLEE